MSHPTFSELLATFFKIGCLSFGGAAGQIAMMHRMIVDDKGWIEEKDYLAGLNFCTLLPGPEAQQLATYIGWRLHGIAGGVAAGLLFVLPGAVLILVLAQLYVLGTGIPAVDGLLLGIKAAVIAIIAEAVLKFAKRGLKSRALIGVAIAAFVAMMLFALPFPVVVIGAALAGILIGRASPLPAQTQPETRVAFPARAAALCLALWWLPVCLAALMLGGGHLLVEIGLFFSKLALVTFGGAYALLAYLSDEAVARGWVSAAQMLDALGFAETTPGPTILVNPFVAFIAGGKKGGLMAWFAGLMALWTTFAPSFLWIFVGGPYLGKITANRTLSAALAGISAAVVGIISTVGTKFALVFLFSGIAPMNIGPLHLPRPAAWPDPLATALVLLALALTFLRHWPMLRMLMMLAAIGLCFGLLGLR